MNMLDNTEFVSKVGKRRLKSLVIPERKKKRCIDSAIELLEADESSESKKCKPNNVPFIMFFSSNNSV